MLCVCPRNVSEFLVYQKALKATDAVSATIAERQFGRDFNLRAQLLSSSGSVAPLIAEGFGQGTDRLLARYLARAQGSELETIGHLRTAAGRRYLALSEVDSLSSQYTEIGKMLTGWIGYLRRTVWKDR